MSTAGRQVGPGARSVLGLLLGLGLAALGAVSAGCASTGPRADAGGQLLAIGGAIGGAWGLSAPSAGGPDLAPDLASDLASHGGEWHTASRAPSVVQDEWGGGGSSSGTRYVTLLGGTRSMDGDWAPVDDQDTFGIELDETDPASGDGWEAGLLYASDDASILDPFFGLGNVSLDVDTIEVYSGWRRTFRAMQDGFHPYVAAGLAVLWTEIDVSAAGGSGDDDDVVPALYLRLGVHFDLGPGTRLGVDYRHVFADDLEFAGVDIDTDYDQVLLTLGWAF
jgi:hypothetical protein